MDNQKVDLFILTNQKYFEPTQLQIIRERLQAADDAKLLALSSIDYKDPSMMLLVSIFAGTLGVDRFMVGDWRCQAPDRRWLWDLCADRLVSDPRSHKA